jgi:hypothetical protein
MEFSVMSGVWVSAVGEPVIYNIEIDGPAMDTTFRVIRQYHTAILLALIHNVGFPLVFSFGPRECVESYDRFYTAFRDELNGDLSQYIFLSDQGAALKVISRRHPRNFFCFRHLLQELRKYKHDQAIGNLVKVYGQKEFHVLCNL